MSHDDHHHVPSDTALRVKALESALTDLGLVKTEDLDAIVDLYQNKVGPRNGAKVIARAWADPGFKATLLRDGTAAIAEYGFPALQGEDICVVENTPEVHNLVVCTLCSCYPWPVLGLPPAWYKSSAYRSRAVSEPRAVLKEFGITLDEEVELRVWDSTAETRYLVMPMRPAGSEDLDEDALADLVTRNAMIGTALLEPVSANSGE
ncbi:MAG: nitrile hydratase subunit alpha [Pseudomonadota bacterium]